MKEENDQSSCYQNLSPTSIVKLDSDLNFMINSSYYKNSSPKGAIKHHDMHHCESWNTDSFHHISKNSRNVPLGEQGNHNTPGTMKNPNLNADINPSVNIMTRIKNSNKVFSRGTSTGSSENSVESVSSVKPLNIKREARRFVKGACSFLDFLLNLSTGSYTIKARLARPASAISKQRD
ncbi:unnamed protein product [Moneuplotes crassus]|uniref:Uncharacterized protein n=1 Tax=Euplotes crassus TaxID=5936 RepID=A0AAD2D7B3_EUPCR|nr:unnamed protein product [Moneuplotes crassus]